MKFSLESNRILLAALVVVLLATVGGSASASASQGDPVVHGHVLKDRWVYVQSNYQVDDNVQRVIGILDRAHAAGYNGALLTDSKFGRLDDGSLLPRYYTNLQAVLRHAQALGLKTIPATAAFGYSGSLLWHDPDLAEGLPVRNARFRATDGTLVPDDAEPVSLANGGFDDVPASGHQFPGWAWQDKPGETTFVDRQERHDGTASLRMTDIGTTNPPHGNGRINQRLQVEPFHNYHISVWVKTQDFRGGDVRVLVLGRDPARTLQWNSVPVTPTSDWWRFDVTFNSLAHTEVQFYFGVWGGGTGTIWWDTGRIEPAGLVNTIRRPGAPVRITSADGLIEYQELQDVDRIADPLTGRVPYKGVYDLWHEPPAIGIPDGSRIADGDHLRVSWYHMAVVYGFQVAASLTEPKVFDIAEGQMSSVRSEFDRAAAFSGWMFSHDEIRVHGWDESPKSGTGTPGENLAYNFTTLYDLALDLDRDAVVHAWSDMFDPFHNAGAREDPYYLVNGDWHGSWDSMPSDVVIMNWNHNPDRRRDSAQFFSDRGHRQILAGYYDTPPESFSDRQWLADLEGVSRIEGVLYTQWGSGYDNLEAWAEHVWGTAPTATPTSPPPDYRLFVPACRQSR